MEKLYVPISDFFNKSPVSSQQYLLKSESENKDSPLAEEKFIVPFSPTLDSVSSQLSINSPMSSSKRSSPFLKKINLKINTKGNICDEFKKRTKTEETTNSFSDTVHCHKNSSKSFEEFDSTTSSPQEFSKLILHEEINDDLDQIIETSPRKESKLLKNYEISDEIGRGMQGVVYKVIEKSTKEVLALKKIVVRDDESKMLIENEIEILKKLSHPNIIKFKESFFDSNLKVYLIITEYFPSISLSRYLHLNKDLMNETKIKNIIFSILNVINYLHANNICHRDLNLGNILISYDESSLKVIDFGLSRTITNRNFEIFSPAGDYRCRAPEFDRLGFYSQISDLWQIGIIFYELITSHEIKTKCILKLIGNNMFIYENFQQKISQIGFSLLKKLLCPEPELRITAFEGLKDVWFSDQNL